MMTANCDANDRSSAERPSNHCRNDKTAESKVKVNVCTRTNTSNETDFELSVNMRSFRQEFTTFGCEKATNVTRIEGRNRWIQACVCVLQLKRMMTGMWTKTGRTNNGRDSI